MPSEQPARRLRDNVENVDRLERFTAGMDFGGFVANEQAVFASLHALLILSEAARKLGETADRLVPGLGRTSEASATCCGTRMTMWIRPSFGG